MRFNCHRKTVARAFVLLLSIPAFAVTEQSKTFVITVSLPSPTIHVGDALAVEETVLNPTDHIVFIGDGLGVGSGLELLNEKGEDVGRRAMGVKGTDDEEPVVILHSNKHAMRPGGSSKVIWKYHPESGSLVPGTYKLRSHIRDMDSREDVYSNMVVLTVLP